MYLSLINKNILICRENLASDKFLVSQMDSDHYVSISTLANFNMVKKLTGDIDLVTEVLRGILLFFLFDSTEYCIFIVRDG